MTKPWMQLCSGGAVDLLAITREQVVIPDLVRSICRMPRFLAHTIGAYPWTVGEHCMLVADILAHFGAPPVVQLEGLVHDLPEGIYGDMPSPVKQAMAELGAGEAWRTLTSQIDGVVFGVVGVGHPRDLVKRADLIAFAIEQRDLMAACSRDWELPEYAMAWPRLEPSYMKTEVEREYMKRLAALRTATGGDEYADIKAVFGAA